MNAALTEAFAATESITRSQARNFYYGIRLLPRSKRTALCAVYALARRIDDIGDGEIGDGGSGDGESGDLADQAPAERRLRQLTELSAQLDGIDRAAESGDPVLLAVAEVSRHFPIPLGAFQELIQGVQLDVRGARYETFEELTQYCRYVAGSIGRLCLGVFGSQASDLSAPDYADALGIGLQQTNILRDIREDLLAGRVYLPAKDLERFGVQLRLGGDGRLSDEGGRLSELIRFSAKRAGNWYSEGLRLLPLLDWRSRSSCAAMAAIYRQLLGRIAADPSLVFGGRLSLSGTDKGRIAVRALMGAPA